MSGTSAPSTSLSELAFAAEACASASATNSTIHGPRHWRDVARVGALIRGEDPAPSPRPLFLFAALHDTQRLNDGTDPDHGSRAADALPEIPHGLAGEDLELLVHALRHHTGAGTHEDPTIGACWDADRLTLERVGITPEIGFISTPVVRRDLKRFRARALEVLISPDVSWDEISKSYAPE